MAKFKCNVEGAGAVLHVVPPICVNNIYFEMLGGLASTGVQLDDVEVRRLIRKLEKWLARIQG